MFGRGKHLECPRCRRRQSRDIGEREHVECRRRLQPLQNSDEMFSSITSTMKLNNKKTRSITNGL